MTHARIFAEKLVFNSKHGFGKRTVTEIHVAAFFGIQVYVPRTQNQGNCLNPFVNHRIIVGYIKIIERISILHGISVKHKSKNKQNDFEPETGF